MAAKPAPAAAQAARSAATSSDLDRPGRIPSPEPGPSGSVSGARTAEVVTRPHTDNHGSPARGGAPDRPHQPRISPASAPHQLRMSSLTKLAVPLGVRPTFTPTFSSASFLA